eukprot:scaffold1085_cov407-Prasinococcus_capsulatus_cf.AAC.11
MQCAPVDHVHGIDVLSQGVVEQDARVAHHAAGIKDEVRTALGERRVEVGGDLHGSSRPPG